MIGASAFGYGSALNGQLPSLLTTETVSTGDAGNLMIETRQLIVGDGAAVSTDTSGQGQEGTLAVTASEFVELS